MLHFICAFVGPFHCFVKLGSTAGPERGQGWARGVVTAKSVHDVNGD
jgi:hypothetical protein